MPKPGPAEWSFTAGLRPVNRVTYLQSFLLPTSDAKREKAAGAEYSAKFDLIHRYWQLELHPESRKYQSFITLDGIYSARRVLHGSLIAYSHLPSTIMLNKTPALRDVLLLWIDSMIIPVRTVDALLERVK